MSYDASNIERPIELRALALDLLIGVHRVHRVHLEYRHEYQRHDRDQRFLATACDSFNPAQ
jgi:hypothetical protein